MSFSNVFGGGTLQAADVAYRAVTLAANTTLVWPPLSQSSTDYAARAMDVTASVGGLSLTLPPANGVSTGYGLLINNVGANTFAVLKNDGTTLDTIPAGAVHYLQVTDNTTVGGLWDVIGFGSSTTAANAAALQGSGLSVSGIGDLQAASLVYVNSANYTVVYTDRANTLVWTGGSGTYTLPLSSAPGVGSDFFFELRNGDADVVCSRGRDRRRRNYDCAGSHGVRYCPFWWRRRMVHGGQRAFDAILFHLLYASGHRGNNHTDEHASSEHCAEIHGNADV